VRRHREGRVSNVNIEILGTNCRALEISGKAAKGTAAYCKPGFELDQEEAPQFYFRSNQLEVLLSRQLQEWPNPWPVDARPRISQNKVKPKNNGAENWIDLEHARMRDAMLPRKPDSTFTILVKRDA